MHKISITTKLICTFIVVIGLLLASFGSLIFKTYEYTLLAQGRSLARQVILFRHWATGYDGIWSKNAYSPEAGYLLSFKSDKGIINTVLEESLEKTNDTAFYLHNPALATRELSTLSQEKYGWTFRVVSTRNMSPQSAPDDYEAQAIASMQKSSRDEYWGWEGKNFRFTKALYITKKCLQCHGTKQEIPPTMLKGLKAKYEENVAQATGYKEGEMRGIISVNILPPDPAVIIHTFLNIYTVTSLLLAFGVLWFFTKLVIITRLKKLSEIAFQASTGQVETNYDFKVDGLEIEDVSDEISKLAIAMKRLPGLRQAFKKKNH